MIAKGKREDNKEKGGVRTCVLVCVCVCVRGGGYIRTFNYRWDYLMFHIEKELRQNSRSTDLLTREHYVAASSYPTPSCRARG